MRPRSRLSIVLTSLGVTFAFGSAAHAATVSVSGNVVGAKGYTLIAMSPTRILGLAKLDARGRFKVKTARGVTLQLLRPDNTFFGPVVIGHAKGRAYEALSGRSLRLGTIRLHAGYAAPSRRVGASETDRHVWAYADRAGKPIGAGNLGLLIRRHKRVVRAAQDGGPGSSALPSGGDPTHVGIVTAFNADVTGAGVPNAESPASAQASGNGLFTEMFMPLAMSVNTDAAGVTPTQVSDLVKSDLRLDFYLDGHAAGGAPVSGASVDCGTLTYCARGIGTGTVSGAGITHGLIPGTHWDGTVPANSGSPGVFSVQIAPSVGTRQISSGDVFLVHYRTPAGDVIQPTTLTMYFLTVPAVASFDAGAGTQAVSYPVAQDAPGTQANPIRMTSGQITLHIWRPQRAAIPGEAGRFFDIGHLHYGIPVTAQAGAREAGCPGRFYSGLSPSLAISQTSQDQFYNQLFPLRDTADDAPSDPASRLSFTLDLAGCLAADGISTSAPVQLPITAVDEPRQGGTDRGVQTVSVCLPGCDVGASPNGPQPGGP